MLYLKIYKHLTLHNFDKKEDACQNSFIADVVSNVAHCTINFTRRSLIQCHHIMFILRNRCKLFDMIMPAFVGL